LKRLFAPVLVVLVLLLALPVVSQAPLQPSDIYRLHAAGDPAFSPDGSQLAYVVANFDRPGRPYPQLWLMDIASGATHRLGDPARPSGDPVWSPDGKWIAFHGTVSGKTGLVISSPDGRDARFVASVEGTNSPEPGTGNDVTWSPDSRRIAFVSAVPGPETALATGDPMVITRYLYRPTASEGFNPYNDNRRLHLFLVDLAGGAVRQLTSGNGYEHSVAWSPRGDLIVYAAESGFDADRFFNYDLFTVNPDTGAIHRLTSTEGCEFAPVWSPDGSRIAFAATKRGLTDRETNMEDTHEWVMNADGSGRREIGAVIDNRQGHPQWSPDGSALLFTVQERGNVHIYRLPVNGGPPAVEVGGDGMASSFDMARDGSLAYSFASPTDMEEIYLKTSSGSRRLTDVNRDVLGGRPLGRVEPFTFISNDMKWNIEAFLVHPVNFNPAARYPLIVVLHGGPHGQQGVAFSLRDQLYAAHGYAVLNVNYRGSTGYGQAFADAVFRDQNGDEANDVLWAVSAALRRYLWLDPQRMGIEGISYGGQLTYWLITQTNAFKAAVPIAGITNLISYNYLTYYNQYEAMEWGAYPQQDNLMNLLWQRSAIRHVAAVHTPTLIMHGANDPDVPIPEAEQFYIALQDVGVQTEFVIYPREGHSVREVRHIVDSIERACNWYDDHFRGPAPTAVTLP
jgi:dipeptidyl aminopeptidase/acylaminoacyl peptidase